MQQGKLIDVRGLQQVNRALREVAPDLRRDMYREIGSLVKSRVTAAKSRMPNVSGNLVGGTFLTKAGSKKALAAGAGGRKQGLFGFQAISSAPHASILDLAKAGRPNLITTLNERYGEAPRFLGREFLPAGQGGTLLWRQSRNIVERYIGELNRRIESQAAA